MLEKTFFLIIIFTLMGVIISFPQQAAAYLIDGDISDWGVTLSIDEQGAFNNSWAPMSGYYTEANDWGPENGIPGGGEASDIEAIYFNNDENFLYFAGVGSISPYGTYYQYPYNWSFAFGTGDLAIKFGVAADWKTSEADYALGLRPTALEGSTGYRNPASAGMVKKNTDNNLQWYHVNGYSWAYFDQAYFNANTGVDLGMAVVAWAKWENTENNREETGSGYIATPQNDTDKGTWIWEAAIPVSYFGEDYFAGQTISVHWAADCVNDYIGLNATAVPEPQTFVLILLGAMILAGPFLSPKKAAGYRAPNNCLNKAA
ncbi:MAG: hypothetical protein ABH836_08085 [Candidatus Omnitrophota bacterium]